MPIEFAKLSGALQFALLVFDEVEQAEPTVQPRFAAVGQGEHRRREDRVGGMVERLGSRVEAETVRARPVAQQTRRGHVQVPRFVTRAEPAGELARSHSPRLVDARLRQDHGGRQIVAAARGVRHLRCDRRPFVRAGYVVHIEPGRKIEPAREQHVARLFMSVRSRADAPHQREPIAALGQQRQMLADLDARSARGDRPKFAAYCVGCVGLEVETILMRDAPSQKNEQH